MRSRKENRLGAEAGSFPSATGRSGQGPSSQAPEHVETRKVSQPLFGLIGAGMSMGSIPADPSAASTPRPVVDGSTAASVAVPAEEPPKRRNLTPASARVIDAEDEPRRQSPRIRTGPVELATESQK